MALNPLGDKARAASEYIERSSETYLISGSYSIWIWHRASEQALRWAYTSGQGISRPFLIPSGRATRTEHFSLKFSMSGHDWELFGNFSCCLESTTGNRATLWRCTESNSGHRAKSNLSTSTQVNVLLSGNQWSSKTCPLDGCTW